MGLILEDGKGSGKTVGVSTDNRLETEAITYSLEHHANHSHGKAFSLCFSQSNTAAGDCIAYILNSDDEDMILEGVSVGVTDCTANDSIYFKLGDTGTRNGATALTPVNCNSGSGNSAVGTFEKGADLDGGSATLAGGSEYDRIIMAGITDKVSTYYNFEQGIILPKNRTFTMWVDGSGTGTWYITLHFNYHGLEQ